MDPVVADLVAPGDILQEVTAEFIKLDKKLLLKMERTPSKSWKANALKAKDVAVRRIIRVYGIRKMQQDERNGSHLQLWV